MANNKADDPVLADVKDEKNKPLNWKEELIDWVRFLGSAFVLYMLFTTFAFALFFVPSESMQPGMQVGDRFVVSKWTYGWSRESVPFGLGRILPSKNDRIFFRLPKRGDVAVFVNPNNQMVMVKRVIGLPGDTVETRGGRLYLNGEQVERTLHGVTRYRDRFGNIQNAQIYSEKLGRDRKRAHKIYEFADDLAYAGWAPDNAGPFSVKEGHLFVMGDNRDNSNDGRSPTGPGQIPMQNLVGKGELVLFTFARCKKETGLDCPSSRLWRLM